MTLGSSNDREARTSSPWRWLAVTALIVMTLLTYVPAMNAGFIWDDDDYLTRNPTLRSVEGLRQIWFKPGAVPQYYPLVHTMFWVEHNVWGLHPAGYHVVNILLHGLGAVLLWITLLRLRLPTGLAWVAAAVFALHPVHVESVAWITERKNVLSTVLYLLALLAYMRFDPLEASERRPPKRWGWYGLSIACFIGALCSKTVTCSLPAAILLLIWWKRGRIRMNDALHTLPMFVLGAMGGAMTAWMEKHHVGAAGAEWDYSLLERLLIAGRVVWFYASKLLWPANLAFVYPRWQIDAGQLWQYVFPIAAIAVIITLFVLRRRIALGGRGPLVAVLFFGGTLFPALGFFDVYPFRFSFVADHFQYLASIGLIVLIVAASARAIKFAGTAAKPIAIVLTIALLSTLAILSFLQARIYTNLETLWRDTLAKNPDSFMPLHNLAFELASQNRFQEAIPYYRKALELNPAPTDRAQILTNLGVALTNYGDRQQGVACFRLALESDPRFVDAMKSLGLALLEQGQFDQAIAQFQNAIEIQPRFIDAHISLGTAYARQRRLDEAVKAFEVALGLNAQDFRVHYNLGLAMQELGRPDRALMHLRQAAQLAPDIPNVQFKLGQFFAGQRDMSQAIEHYRQAVAIAPNFVEARNNLGLALIERGEGDEAIAHFEVIVTQSPRNPYAHATLAALLIHAQDPKRRDPQRAIILAQRACQLTGESDPQMLGTLAEALALAGEWGQAAMAARRAAMQARSDGLESYAQEFDRRAETYESVLQPATDPSTPVRP